MAARKTHDLAVVVREYQDRNGETKKQWLTVGAVIEYDDGGRSLLFDRHINLAGLPGEGPVRVSMFEPRPKDGAPPTSAPAQPRPAQQAQRQPAAVPDYSDDIPF